MRKEFCLWVVLVAVFVLLSGCATVERLSLLMKIDSNQKAIDAYLAQQEQGFSRLKDDYAKGSLKTGVVKGRLAGLYGDPVFCKGSGEGEKCIYRRPTEFFNSDKVILYFDGHKMLDKWEFKPAVMNLKEGG